MNFRHHLSAISLFLGSVGILVIMSSCSSSTKLTVQRSALYSADSLFKSGDYQSAKSTYREIIDSFPSKEATKNAMFMLGVINLHYNNPDADWDSALTEFQTFASMFPDDPRIGQVKSWISVLSTVKQSRKEAAELKRKLRILNNNDERTTRTNKATIDSLTETLSTIQLEKDTLIKRNAELKRIIVELERKCQQGGM